MFFRKFAKYISQSVSKVLKEIYTCNIELVKMNESVECKNSSMLNDPNLLKPPEQVSGMVKLDKTLFKKTILVPTFNLNNVKISSVIPAVKKYLLKMDNFKPVENLDENRTKVFLNPSVIKSFSDFSEDDKKQLASNAINEENLVLEERTLSYENFSSEAVLRAVLPKDKDGVASFSKIGHIIHVNLREHLHPFKELIGEVLFDKNKGCRSVVNKINNIDNTYRNFQMEILKGDADMLTQVKENRCTFDFDFSKVYWNSRLCTEHERIVKMVEKNDVFFDVFAGVGPFAIPIAKKKCTVLANDLNPESFRWLNHNAKSNKIDTKCFKSFNKDGRDFILEEVKELLPGFLKEKRKVFITMNLPAMAVEFLGAFVGLCSAEEIDEEISIPATVIVYCFAKGQDCEDIARELLFKNIGCDISEKIIEVFRVRTVSNFKEMMRISFKLDRDILTGEILTKTHKRKHENDANSSNAKKHQNGEKQEEDE